MITTAARSACYQEFNDERRIAIEVVLTERDPLVLLHPGAGKTVCYQVLAPTPFWE